MIPRYLTDARHGISSSAILKLQSGLLLLYHMTSHFAGDNLKPSCIALVSHFFSAMVICLYNMSSPMRRDHHRMQSFVLGYPGSVVLGYPGSVVLGYPGSVVLVD